VHLFGTLNGNLGEFQ